MEMYFYPPSQFAEFRGLVIRLDFLRLILLESGRIKWFLQQLDGLKWKWHFQQGVSMASLSVNVFGLFPLLQVHLLGLDQPACLFRLPLKCALEKPLESK